MSFKASGLREKIEDLRKTGAGVLVVGLGISGVESARFLAHRGIQVQVVERQTKEVFRERSKFAGVLDELVAAGIKVHFGVDGEQVAPILDGIGLVVLSPGVPLESAIVATISRLGVSYISELELGVQLHGGRSVVVTGSNGKSTTVSLIHHILRVAGVRSFLCGNVGTPVIANRELLSEGVEERSTLVVEASSYQLEACTSLKPAVSVLLNVSENHLERHGTLDRYAAAKARVFRLQTKDDFLVANADDPLVRRLALAGRATVALFGQMNEAELSKLASNWAHVSSAEAATDGLIRVCMDDSSREEYSTAETQLLGAHNRFNMAAAILATRRLGVPAPVVQEALRTFQPLEHRLEVCFRESQRIVINDSKSTTVAASVAALTTVAEHFKGMSLALLIGGLSKAGSWEPLLKECQRVGGALLPIVCFGRDGALLGSHCRAAGLSYQVVPTLEDAVRTGLDATQAGGVLLLSPGCASFDQFADFEHRGKVFKRCVLDNLQAAGS